MSKCCDSRTTFRDSPQPEKPSNSLITKANSPHRFRGLWGLPRKGIPMTEFGNTATFLREKLLTDVAPAIIHLVAPGENTRI
jgi:hypothetical protein